MHRGGRTAAPTLWTRKNPRNRTVPGISRLWVKNSVKRNPFQPFFRIKKHKKIYPAFRFERTHLQQGTRTAKSLYGFLEMSRTTDQCTTIDADANEETNADTFASYVRASKKCPTLPVDIDMIEEYFYRNSKKGQHCVQCGYSLEAKAGKYGVYVQCCGAQRHKYKLDEI